MKSKNTNRRNETAGEAWDDDMDDYDAIIDFLVFTTNILRTYPTK